MGRNCFWAGAVRKLGGRASCLGTEGPQRKGSSVREAWVPEWSQEELSVGSQDCRCEGYSKGKLGSMGSAQRRKVIEVADDSVVTPPCTVSSQGFLAISTGAGRCVAEPERCDGGIGRRG